jgi:hypothetical protein
MKEGLLPILLAAELASSVAFGSLASDEVLVAEGKPKQRAKSASR